MKQLADRALLGLHLAGAVLLVGITAVICYDVAGRLLFNRPFAGTAELAAVCLVLLTYLQTPYVIRERKLLRVTFFLDRMPPALRSQMNAFAYFLGGALFIALVIASWEPALYGLASGEFYGNDAFRIPAWPLRFGTLVLWVIAALVCLGYMAEGVRGRLRSVEDQLPE
ncbi:MAG: TRAP transporter small permease [Burkholderiaceae bacterium]|nr:TRAP transporter small permease [Burkholderiaceae bacterium]